MCIKQLGGGPTTIEMVHTALDEFAQLCQIFEPTNPYSINRDPNFNITHPKKGKWVGIKKNRNISYLQYQVNVAAAAVPLP